MHSNMDERTSLSPFEFKDRLNKLAGGCEANTIILDAGRGNPNFLATAPRYGFCQLILFAMSESERSFAYLTKSMGGFPKRENIEERFQLFARQNNNVDGIAFLCDSLAYVCDRLNLNPAEYLYEMCEAILGINYPVPDRMLSCSEKIIRHYLRKEMFGTQVSTDEFDLFAVEGGTAAITCLFNSLRTNHLLKQGDKIAVGAPIFTPYLEIPHMSDYQLKVVHIYADQEQKWQYSKTELDKLRDPEVKAFFLINPSNPPSVKLDDDSLAYIASIVVERPDLVILTDDVYGTFADQFVSLFAICPRNTILVYSFSKYFGATGWRLGVIGIHRDNVLDDHISKLDTEQRDNLHKRYKSIVSDTSSLKFIDRLVADSRSVALNHTAGLSTPQQVQMVLFSLFALMEIPDSYKATVKQLIRDRKRALYRAIDIGFSDCEEDVNAIGYYTILDLEVLSKCIHGQQFANWFLFHTNTYEFLERLAREAHVVLLHGDGFGVRNPSVRVSLANRNEADYTRIGQAIRSLIEDYVEQFNARTFDEPLSNDKVVK